MTVEALYKYGRVNEHSETLFSSPTIWFSAPAQVNDPFECRPWFTFEGTQDQIVESLTRELRKHNPELTPNNATAHAAAIYLEGRHRDPNTWERLRQDVVARLGQRIGLCCLSKINNSILMWSHYSQDHRGYCLEFEATDTTPVFGAAQKVNYAADFPVVDFFNTQKDKQVDLIFLTKYLGWAYEEEWRIIDHQAGPGLHEYHADLLKGVIFGLRMPASDRAKIRAWVQKRGHAVKFYEATQHDRQFAIEVREIE